MEVSNQTNNYNTMSSYQKPITAPVEPQENKYNNQEIYEASQGNVIRNDKGNLSLTPQGETNLANKQADNAAEVATQEQAQKDAQRETATDYLAHKSQQSQIEIYLAVATDSSANETASVIETLRDVQKQNNAVEAYATYQQNQNSTKPALY